ncbi:MAG: SDR family oxidoreductase [Symploca sp. SIO2G7]|nr:SDR family oxidoreductase [Symploca sp. SIO2G7]
MNNNNSVALVTGANRGIGFEVCRQLAEQGYTVLLTARNPDKAQESAEKLRTTGLQVIPQQLDVADAASITRAYGRVAQDFGYLDALINNAAVDYDTDQNVLTADLDRVQKVFEINTIGTWRVTQTFIPLLRKSKHGRIVNVSSGAGALSSMRGGTPAYSLSKAALNALTLMLAASLKESGILVNAICPGWVATDMGGQGGRPVAEGAASVVWGVTLPDQGPTGGFFRDGQALQW